MCKTFSGVLLFLVFNFSISSHDLSGNSGAFSTTGVPACPGFSVDHGFFSTPFFLGLTSSDATVRIFYTKDGSNPALTNGNLYSGPFLVETTSVIRAVCIATDNSVSKTTTRTYLFPDDIIRQPNDPGGYPAEWAPFTSINGIAPAIMRWILK